MVGILHFPVFLYVEPKEGTDIVDANMNVWPVGALLWKSVLGHVLNQSVLLWRNQYML